MLHPEVLPAGWERAAKDLAAQGVLDGFYLAGGTGLALQLGHRHSVDLDLFSRTEFDTERLHTRLSVLGGRFLHYPYSTLFPLLQFEALALADARDIACMKVGAIASRGSRRDFVDLYVTARMYGLREILGWFETKYAGATYSRVHVFKALTYFSDAEQQPMPDLLVPVDWSDVKRFFTHEVPRFLQEP